MIEIKVITTPEQSIFNQDPCATCSQNPKNNPFATGICHCALPSMYNIMY